MPSAIDLDYDAVVVGGGLAGLTAATLLVHSGKRVLVLEAAEQVGGRIQSLIDPTTGRHLADLGPTWVWPDYQPVAAEWLKRLGLETLPQFDDGAVIVDEGPDVPVSRQFLPGQHGIRRISGGVSAIIEQLASRLPDGVIETNAAVKQIADQADWIQVTYDGSGGESSVRCRFVIVAAPLRVAATYIEWSPLLDRSLIQAMIDTPTWMAVHAKAVMIYDRPFWRDNGLSGRIASRAGPLLETHDHSGPDGSPAAVFGFIGWPPNVRDDHSDELPGEIVAQLARCLGPEAAQPLALHIEDWALSDHICTPLDLRGPMNHPELVPDIVRQQQFGGRVFLAAAETATRSPGLIEGAFAAGMSVASSILAD